MRRFAIVNRNASPYFRVRNLQRGGEHVHFEVGRDGSILVESQLVRDLGRVLDNLVERGVLVETEL